VAAGAAPAAGGSASVLRLARPPWMAATMAALVLAASLPPLRMSALADLIASAAIWTAASGRDSKMTAAHSGR